MALKLEVGAGRARKPGYLHVDVRKLDGLAARATADALPFKEGVFEEVYSRHVLEHFMLKEAVDVLLEWRRVLAPGGMVYVIVPNVLWHFKQVLDGAHESIYVKERGKNARYWGMGSVYGWQQDQFDVHKFGYWPQLLADLLTACGFEDCRDLTEKPEGREKAPWHLEMQARKANSVGDVERFRRLLDVAH